MRALHSYGGEQFKYEQLIASINERIRAEPDQKESAIGNNLVKVYPVRTILTRYLTSNSDCVVDVLPTFDGKHDGLTPEIREAIVRYVTKLKFKSKYRLFLRMVSSNQKGHDAIDRFIRVQRNELADLLGFQEIVVAHTPYN